jgi:cytochrome c-type biogenesis protein CcmE
MTSIERSVRDRSLAAAVPETQEPVPTPLEPAGSTPTRRMPRRTWLAAVAGVLVLPIAVAAGLTISAAGSGTVASNAAAARVVSAADMEQEYGIKVNLVAVTAAGGLVDGRVAVGAQAKAGHHRFTVVDKAKAIHILHDGASMPELLVEPSGTVIHAPTGMRHKVTLLDGGNYFLLYSNPGGAVQAGTEVSVVIGDIRLEPLDAQS